MEIGPQVVARSPSFGSYSYAPTHRLEHIAARVISELRHDIANGQLFIQEPPSDGAAIDEINYDSGSEELEFTFVCKDPDASPISADELFSDGKIRPFFPLFNSDLVFDAGDGASETRRATVRLPLRKLMSQEDEMCEESMPALGDDLEGIPDGTYCVWRPRPQSPERCKKSKSTGSSRRWRFRDLLGRSSSDGKDTFIFLSPAAAGRKVVSKPANDPKVVDAAPRSKSPTKKVLPAMDAQKEDDRRRSYVPYRQQIVGFFANVNGLTRGY